MTQEDFYAFMNSRPLAVIATTAANGTSQAAVIGFGQTEHLELVFGTSNTTRKYANIQGNAHVAFVIGWESAATIQYEGVARELRPDELDIVRSNYWRKNPHAEEYAKDPNERYFLVSPTWVRYTDLSSNPWETKELRFE